MAPGPGLRRINRAAGTLSSDTPEATAILPGSLSHASRHGDHVHRDSGPWTPAIHSFLRHLHEHGFVAAPRPVGLDGEGREVLTWVAGKAAHMPWPRVLRSQVGLRELAELVRSFHDAARSFVPPADASWRTGARPKPADQIVIHGDLGPWNVIYRGSRPAALIDWDLAEPSPAVFDVAHLAWTAVPIRPEPVWRAAGFGKAPDFVARLQAIADGYGEHSRRELHEALLAFMERQRQRRPVLAKQGIEPWRRLVAGGALPMIDAELEWARGALG